MNEAAQHAADAALPGASMVTGLASYGPLGVILGVFLLSGLYMFKRMFDRTMASADASTNQKLDALVDVGRQLVDGLNRIRQDLDLYVRVQERVNTPTPVTGLPGLPHSRRPRGGGGAAGGE